MKGILFMICLCCQAVAGFSQRSLYELTVTGFDTRSYPLSTLQGKTVMIFLLPATQTAADGAFLARIDSITQGHAGNLQTIAVPSLEDGYGEDSTHALLNWCRSSLDTGIVLSQPLYTHKSSGARQDGLFQWLTRVSGNTHFDDEVAGACEIYFIDTSGVLYGVFDPDARFSNRALNKVLK